MTAVTQNFSCDCSHISRAWEYAKPGLLNALNTLKKVAILAAQILASAALLLFSPYAFSAGMIVGATLTKELAPRLDGILDLWSKNFPIKVVMVFTAVLTWPVTSHFISAWAAASWAVRLNPPEADLQPSLGQVV